MGMAAADSARAFDSHEPVALRRSALVAALAAFQTDDFDDVDEPRAPISQRRLPSLLADSSDEAPGFVEAKQPVDGPRAMRSEELRWVLLRFGFGGGDESDDRH
jgi:hypothetical protein